ncbi:MAG: SMP-30/gluconolactonase/LRE family protein [Phycisphaerales bacterium]|nr:SMP-30/gluconolactonase/LRE family protein [Phycisphaerales bacterium]
MMRDCGVCCALLAAVLMGGCDGGSDQGPPLLVFGRTGRGPGEFSYPRAAVSDAQGRAFIVDKTGRIQCFSAQGEYQYHFAMPETAAGKPTGLGIDARNRIYAADTHYSRVMVFEPDGREVTRFGTFGEGVGQFRMPTDVAVDSDGFIYVSEYGGNDRVSKFTPGYEYVMSFAGRDAGAAHMERPQSICVAPDATLWIADSCRHRVCHFTRDGAFLSSFGRLGSGPGEFQYPYNVAMLSDGTLAVCEYGNNRVQRLRTDGTPLGVWGSAGRDVGSLAYPWALTVLPKNQLLIVDSGNNRVQVLDAGMWRAWSKGTSQ